MYEKKIEENLNCGIYVASKVFGGKWKCCILDAINRGISRPVNIHRYLCDPSKRIIEMQLAELLLFGVVERCTEEDVYPKKSEYKLTPFGETILPLLNQIDSWGSEHSELVKQRLSDLQAIE